VRRHGLQTRRPDGVRGVQVKRQAESEMKPTRACALRPMLRARYRQRALSNQSLKRNAVGVC
jgi:hypothetical protein